MDGTWVWADPAAVRVGAGQDAVVDRCLTSARRAQLTAYALVGLRLVRAFSGMAA